jgi:hypothetical protein
VDVAQISGEDLVELDEQTIEQVFGITSQFARRKVAKAIQDLVGGSKQREESAAISKAKYGGELKKVSLNTDLPLNKDYAAFISHKKQHSKYGDSSETMAIRLKVNLLLLSSTSFSLKLASNATGYAKVLRH